MTVSRLVVSIVVHRSPLEELARTLSCLHAAGEKLVRAGKAAALSVVVVDNDSGPGYRQAVRDLLARLERRGLRCRLVCSPVNGGYGLGHNLVAAGEEDFRLILNPDVFLEPDSLVRGMAFLQCHPRVGLLVPRVVGDRGGPEYLCKRYPTVVVLLLRGFAPGWVRNLFPSCLERYEMRDLDWERPRFDLELVSGCCMLMRGRVWRETGGFSPDYFLYFEDFDLSLRAARKTLLAYAPDFRITHLGGGAGRKGWRHRFWFIRSAWRFFNRHGWKWY